MTENKRFTVPDKYKFSHSKVQLNGQPLINDEIVRLLNTNDEAFVENFYLKKEINELKSINQDHQDHIADFYADYYRLEEENKKLKAFKDKVFDLIDEKINECEKELEINDIDWNSRHTTAKQLLIELKKELQE